MANLALQPMEQISHRLDTLAAQEALAETAATRELRRVVEPELIGPQLPAPERESRRGDDAVVQVSDKIERLGRRMRNVEEVFSALNENLDQILSNLQDGIMLFTRELALCWYRARWSAFWKWAATAAGRGGSRHLRPQHACWAARSRQAFDAGMSIVQEEITTEAGRRVGVSLDFIHDDHAVPRTGIRWAHC